MVNAVRNTHVFFAKEDHAFFQREDREDEDTLSGKLFLVEGGNKAAHHVFYDDNILEKESYIVDSWDLDTKSRIPFSVAKELYLVRANLMGAILDRDYFMKKLVGCLKRRAAHFGLPLHPAYEEWLAASEASK